MYISLKPCHRLFGYFSISSIQVFNRHWTARPCKWPRPYNPDFALSMSHLFGICQKEVYPNCFVADTAQVYHGKIKIWVVRLRSNTWTSLAMPVKSFGMKDTMVLIALICSNLHSSPKEVHIDLPQFSWWPWITDPDLGSCQLCQMVLTAICKRPHSKIPYRFKFWHRVFCELLSRPIDKIKMTWGRGRWPRHLSKL